MTMHRDLNPQLFGSQGHSGAQVDSGVDSASISRIPTARLMGAPEEATRRLPYPPVDVKVMEQAIANLKGAMIQMERRTETIGFKMEELARTVHARLERFSQSIVRIEDSQNKSQADTAQRFANVSAKVNERKVGEMKVQELMDRHNSIIRNFENRMLSLQRLASEQEMSLHNAQAALDEARSEISRLKLR